MKFSTNLVISNLFSFSFKSTNYSVTYASRLEVNFLTIFASSDFMHYVLFGRTKSCGLRFLELIIKNAQNFFLKIDASLSSPVTSG